MIVLIFALLVQAINTTVRNNTETLHKVYEENLGTHTVASILLLTQKIIERPARVCYNPARSIKSQRTI